jgi:plasmid stability protein
MASVTVRNVEEAVVRRLRQRAAESGRSLEEELRRILRRAANVDRDEFLAWVEARRLPAPPDVDVVDLLRRERRAR